MVRYFRPDFFANTIYDIDPEWLRDKGIKGLIIDVDNTIMPRDSAVPGSELRSWIGGLREREISLVAVSNNWSARVKAITKELGLELIAPAVKPFSAAFVQALKKMNLQPEETAIVGDQLFTDILGGNWTGLATIMVPPLGEVELIHTRVLRILEKIILRRLAGQVLRDGQWRTI